MCRNTGVLLALVLVSLPSKADYLLERIPDDAVLYAHLSLAGNFQQGGIWGPLFEHPAHRAAIPTLIKAYQTKLDGLVEDDEFQPLFKALQAWRGQVELLLVVDKAATHKQLQLLISGYLDIDAATLEQALQKLAEPDQLGENIEVRGTVGSADGVFLIGKKGGGAKLDFDPVSGKLLLQFAELGTVEHLQTIFQAPVPNPAHGLSDVLPQLDEHNNGAWLWLNPTQARQQYDGDALALLKPLKNIAKKLKDVDALILTTGVVGGKHRLTALLDAPKAAFKAILPQPGNHYQLQAVGKPHYVLGLSLPSPAQMDQSLQGLKGFASEPGKRELSNMDTLSVGYFGISLREWLAALGPEALMFADDAGEYLAIKIRDKTALESAMANMAVKYGWQLQQRAYQGHVIHHLRMPPSESLQTNRPYLPPGWLSDFKWLEHIQRHLFYIEQDGYLLLSSLPQPLMKRLNQSATVSINTWLQTNQGIDPQHALLVASTHFSDVSQRLYTTYIHWLVFMHDLAGQPVNPFDFPPLHTVALPEQTAMGGQLDVDGRFIKLQFNYDISPLDWSIAWVDSNWSALGELLYIQFDMFYAVLDVLMTQEAAKTAHKLKVSVAEHYQQHGEFPNQAEAQQMNAEQQQLTLDEDVSLLMVVPSMWLEADTGAIRMVLERPGHPADGGQYLWQPKIGAFDAVSWVCLMAVVPLRYQDSSCKAVDELPPEPSPKSAEPQGETE